MTPGMKEVETRTGKPIRTVLSDLYTKHGSRRDVARELGISPGALNYWLLKLNLEQRTVLVERQGGDS